jgi:hypothetical protein
MFAKLQGLCRNRIATALMKIDEYFDGKRIHIRFLSNVSRKFRKTTCMTFINENAVVLISFNKMH